MAIVGEVKALFTGDTTQLQQEVQKVGVAAKAAGTAAAEGLGKIATAAPVITEQVKFIRDSIKALGIEGQATKNQLEQLSAMFQQAFGTGANFAVAYERAIHAASGATAVFIAQLEREILVLNAAARANLSLAEAQAAAHATVRFPAASASEIAAVATLGARKAALVDEIRLREHLGQEITNGYRLQQQAAAKSELAAFSLNRERADAYKDLGRAQQAVLTKEEQITAAYAQRARAQQLIRDAAHTTAEAQGRADAALFSKRSARELTLHAPVAQIEAEITAQTRRVQIMEQVARRGGTVAQAMTEVRAAEASLITGSKATGDQLRQLAQRSEQATAAMAGGGGLTDGLIAAARSALRFGGILIGLGSIVTIVKLTRDLFLFNSAMEQSRLAVAATISTAGQFVDAFGKPLPMLEQMQIALEQGSVATRRMLDDSIRLAIPIDALIGSYGIIAGRAAAAGISQEKLIPIMEGLVVLGDRLNLPHTLLLRSIDNVITGLNVERTILGTMLGITQAQVDEARRRGQLEDFLTEKTRGALIIAQENLGTWKGVTTAISNAVRALADDVGEGAFASLKGAARDVLGYIKELREDPDRLSELRSNLTGIADALIAVASIAKTPINIILKISSSLNTISEATPQGLFAGLAPGYGEVLRRGAGALGQYFTVQGARRRSFSMQGGSVIQETEPYEDALARLQATGELPFSYQQKGFVGPPEPSKDARFMASTADLDDAIQKGAATLARGAVTVAQRQLDAAAKTAGNAPTGANLAAYRAAVETVHAQRQARIADTLGKEFPEQAPHLDPAKLAEFNRLREERRAQLQAEADAQRTSDIERLASFTRTEHGKTDALRRALQERAAAELDASRKSAASQKRSAELDIQLAEEQAKYADLFDRRESSRLGRAETLYALRQKELGLEKEALEKTLLAASQRVQAAQTGVFGVAGRDPATQTRALTALIKAQTEADRAGGALEDWHTRRAIAAAQHQIEVTRLTDEYLHLGDVVKSSLTDVGKGIAFGTGDLSDAGRRMGETIAASMIQATLEKKLANFDPMIKKNLFDLGTEGGLGAGVNFIGAMLSRIIGTTGGTGAGAGIVTSGTVNGIDLAVPTIAARGTGVLGTAGGIIGPAALGFGAAHAIASIAGLPRATWPGEQAINWIGGLFGKGSIFSPGPTQEHVNLDSVRDWVGKAGITQSQGSLGGRPAWGDHSIISRVFPGVTDTGPLQPWGQTILAISMAAFNNDVAKAGDAVNAFVNNQQLLGHSLERSKKDLLKMASAAGVDLDTALSKLEEQFDAGSISAEQFSQSVAGTTALFERLPAAIDVSVLALAALDKEGNVTFEHLQRLVQDLQSTIGTGLPAAFEEFVASGSVVKAGRTLAEQFGDTFVKRLSERLLEGTLATGLTQAVATAEEAAELFAAGDTAGGKAKLAEARAEFMAGRREFLTGVGPVARSIREWERSLGIGTSGILDETGMTLLSSYDTPTFARVPGPYGAGMPAIVHGGETVRSPQQEDRILRVLAQIAGALDGGLRGNVNNELTIHVQLDSRDIAYGQERMRSRGAAPGIIVARPIGRR